MRYRPDVVYEMDLTIDLWAKRYSATVRPVGGARVTLANNYAFRGGQAEADKIAWFAWSAPRDSLLVGTVEPRPAPDRLISVETWEEAWLWNTGRRFTVGYDVTPSRPDVDAVTGLANQSADAHTDLAAIVRFAPDGLIDARHDGKYRAETRMPYHAGVSYHVRLTVDLDAKRYSAVVTPAGGTPRKIADGYLFRREQAQAKALDVFAVYCAGGGAAEVARVWSKR